MKTDPLSKIVERPQTEGATMAGDADLGRPAVEVLRPEVGMMVMVDTGERTYNGEHIFPGFVVRVWSHSCINARVLVDGDEVPVLRSLVHVSGISAPSAFNQPRPAYWYWSFDDKPLP